MNGLYKLGRRPATRPFGLRDLSAYAGRMPLPPAVVNYYSEVDVFPIDGNDSVGDCVAAGAAHLIQLWNAEVGITDPVPNANDIVAEYFKLTGGADTGLNEAATLNYWYTQGLFGRKIAGYAPVDGSNLLFLHQAIAFFGAVMIGVNLPESAQEQFASGEPWTVVPGSQIQGGHCIIIAGYDPSWAYAVTWGAVVKVSFAWLAAYMDECWAILPAQDVEAQKGPSSLLDLPALQADLIRLH